MSTKHENRKEADEVKGSSSRTFGIVFTVVFTVIGLFPLLGGSSIRIWALVLGGAFLTVALLRPALLNSMNRWWLRFGLLLHRVTSPVVMGLIFFLAVTPTGLIMRALGKDLLSRRRDSAAASYWIEREPAGPPPDSMSQQF